MFRSLNQMCITTVSTLSRQRSIYVAPVAVFEILIFTNIKFRLYKSRDALYSMILLEIISDVQSGVTQSRYPKKCWPTLFHSF